MRVVGRKKNSLESGLSLSAISQHILKDLEKYSLPKEELKAALHQALSRLERPEERVPVSIFIGHLTVLESTVKFLKEEKGYSLHRIAEILGRDEKNLWHAYHSAQKKMPTRFWVGDSETFVPLNIFSESMRSPLGAIVVYLKEQRQVSFHEIAKLLARDDRTIWTTYTRIKKKFVVEKKETLSELQEEDSFGLFRKYQLQNEILKNSLQEIISYLEEESEERVPVSIFIGSLTVLESTVKYLKEEKGYSLHRIAEILGRDEKNLWHAYHSAQKKMPTRFWVGDSETFVPLNIFSESMRSPLGAIVVYLKEQRQLSFHEIAKLLARDDRTIWTTYTRIKKEHEKK